MTKKTLFQILAALLVCALLPAAAFAETEQYYLFTSYPVDVEALKELEQTDAFDVRVTRKVVTDDVNQAPFNSNPDMLSLTVENHSDKTVTSLVILAVAYDDRQESAELYDDSPGIVMATGFAKRKISTLTFETVSIAPGGTAVVSTPCRHVNFTGARVLVAQYTDSEGTTYTNELYPEWQELALGSPTIYLD